MSTEPIADPARTVAPSEKVITLPPQADARATDAAKSVPLAPPPQTAARDWVAVVDWSTLGLVVVLSVLTSSIPAFNADVWMHLATGRLLVEGKYLPTGSEPFSCATEAVAGHDAVPWINHSWLYALLLYVSYEAVGGMGVIIIKACGVGILTIILAMIRTRDTPLFVIVVCLTLTVLALSLRQLLQPVLVSYLFLGVTLLILHRAGVFQGNSPVDGSRDRSRWLWAMPVLCFVWVNLDNWFILGPVVVGLSWAGLALQRWRRQENRVPSRRLGAVFGMCLLACLVNPFHVQAWQLPPELAYPLVRAGDGLGIPMPNGLVAGGRTLAVLHDADPDLPVTLSPFARRYRVSPTLGYTIAGASIYPLLVLGLLSFALNAWLSFKPGGPAFQSARFLVWLFFAGLACLLQRLIPFYAIVAAPLIALNVGDLVACWTRPTADSPPSPWQAPVRLGRLAWLGVLFVLLLLAWPGWLTGPHDFGGRLHVGWDIPIDPSLRRAAEEFVQTPEAPEPARVFSTGLDFACYCAYFGGGKVKGFIDKRYNLFPNAAADYINVRQALFNKQRRKSSQWSSVFTAYHLNHAAVENFLNTPVYVSWWAEPGRWRQRFADKAVAVFAWSGEQQPWPGDAVLESWNRLAFGPRLPSERPSATGLPEPTNRSLFDRYLEQPLSLPQAAFDIDLKLMYGLFITGRAVELAQLTLPTGARPQVLPMYSLSSVPLTPGAMNGPWAMTWQVLVIQELAPQVLFWSTVEPPPAVPILGLRRAWHVAAAAPNNERSYSYLYQAVNRLQQQEEYWVSRFGPPSLTLRATLRHVQLVSALRAATEIGIINPAQQYQVCQNLAQEYLQRHALDLAAEYLGRADEALAAAMPNDPQLMEDWRKEKKQLAERRKSLDAEVKQRKSSFDLKNAHRKPMDKILEATQGSYRIIDKDNQEQVDPQGWGLTGMTLQLLDDLDPRTLPPEQQSQWGYLSIDLLFKTGQARQAAQLLERFATPLAGPGGLPFRIYRAATQGNYDELAQLLAERDGLLAEQEAKLQPLALTVTAGLVTAPGAVSPAYCLAGAPQHWLDAVNAWRMTANELFNTRTLRGTVALEAGDTPEAQRLFAGVLHQAGTNHFTERTIAERYAALLAQYQRP